MPAAGHYRLGTERAKKAAEVLAKWDRAADNESDGTLLFYRFLVGAGDNFPFTPTPVEGTKIWLFALSTASVCSPRVEIYSLSNRYKLSVRSGITRAGLTFI
jgi:hypothetical protein